MEWVHFIPRDQQDTLESAAKNSQSPVLIAGAPGTGKGQIARWIHLHGPRASKPMQIAHHRSSLVRQIQDAADGSLILQEVGEWPLADQRKLLEHLASGQGARIIATTDQNLEKRVQAQLFNADLLAQLSRNRIEMPALSKRAGEFREIAGGLIAELSREIQREAPTVSDEAWQKLSAYDWPGNLRELRNVLKVALTTCQQGVLQPSDFPQFGYDRTEFHATREAFEKTYLEELLRACDGSVDRAATLSGMPATTIAAKAAKYSLTIKPASR